MTCSSTCCKDGCIILHSNTPIQLVLKDYLSSTTDDPLRSWNRLWILLKIYELVDEAEVEALKIKTEKKRTTTVTTFGIEKDKEEDT
jgi:hypothetical protein